MKRDERRSIEGGWTLEGEVGIFGKEYFVFCRTEMTWIFPGGVTVYYTHNINK